MGSVVLVDKIKVTPLSTIAVKGGDVQHILKKDSGNFHGFGEAYFSSIEFNSIKAWKKHKQMTLNLVAPVGNILFIFIDPSNGYIRKEIIGEGNYKLLTVPPGIWFGFKGLKAGKNLLLNLANIAHDPEEIDRVGIDEFKVDWTEK